MGKLSCSQDPTQDTKILFNFNIWVGYGLSLDHTGQTKLYKPQHRERYDSDKKMYTLERIRKM
jgi:hypothetical protein